jgi:NADPH2:quinone reductase
VKARAIVMRRTGGPDVLVEEEVELAPIRAGEIRVRALASAVNHSDLEIRAGNWPIRREPRFPYVPGLEVVGDVVEVAAGVHGIRVGDRVWTSMQGLGGVRAERDGGYAEYVTVSEAAVARLPVEIDAVAFAAIGLAGITAFHGLQRLGPLPGRAIVVTGAQGGVGSVAVPLARAAGANVLTLDRGAPTPAPRSVDGVLDVVAGPRFPSLVGALRHRGIYCLVGAVGGGEVTFDAWSLLDAITLTGYSTEDLDGPGLRAATRAVLALALPPIAHLALPLEQACRAHDLLERREVQGRVVLVPAAAPPPC